MPRNKVLVEISQRIIAAFKDHETIVDNKFIYFMVDILARDVRCGLGKYDLNHLTIHTVNSFVHGLVSGYTDPKDTTIANLRTFWLLKTTKAIDLAFVQQQYVAMFQDNLKLLINDILQYPETCNKLQLDLLFNKMQVFIVVYYNLGCPKNHELLKLTAQALSSVIGRSDLQNYVLKKKYHRMEYLERLAATVGGILIYNNDGPNGDRENVCDLVANLEMSQRNTSAAFNAALKKLTEKLSYYQSVIVDQLQIDSTECVITFKCTLAKLHWLNQYIITYAQLIKALRVVEKSFKNTSMLIGIELNRYKCVVAKINQTLAMRTAIESELIFPHFVYLAKVWNNLKGYLNHIIELNKLREDLEVQIQNEMEVSADDIANRILKLGHRQTLWKSQTFFERLDELKILETDCSDSMHLQHAEIQEYCALVFVLTNGLLVPAKYVQQMGLNTGLNYGYCDKSHARFGEKYSEEFTNAFCQSVCTNANLAALFNITESMIPPSTATKIVAAPKQSNFNGQTEMVITNDLSVPNWINVTWNKWDYHRETIRMAELRKRQTHDAQTKISFGCRNAQNQTYNTRQDF